MVGMLIRSFSMLMEAMLVVVLAQAVVGAVMATGLERPEMGQVDLFIF